LIWKELFVLILFYQNNKSSKHFKIKLGIFMEAHSAKNQNLWLNWVLQNNNALSPRALLVMQYPARNKEIKLSVLEHGM
jgi:hypothetical protein